VVEDVDHKAIVNGDVSDGFHAAPLAPAARRHDVAPCVVGEPPVVQSVSGVAVGTSVSHSGVNKNLMIANYPISTPTQSRQRLDSATIPGYCAIPTVRTTFLAML